MNRSLAAHLKQPSLKHFYCRAIDTLSSSVYKVAGMFVTLLVSICLLVGQRAHARSPVIEPSQNSTIKVFADVRIFSSIKLNTSIIEVLVRDIGPLQVTVKKIVRCLGDQC
ncbi:unnamed protein product [Boreogadus saida]